MRRFLVFFLVWPVAVAAQTAGGLSPSEAESLWRQHNHDLRLAKTVLPPLYYFVATHPRLAKALH